MCTKRLYDEADDLRLAARILAQDTRLVRGRAGSGMTPAVFDEFLSNREGRHQERQAGVIAEFDG